MGRFARLLGTQPPSRRTLDGFVDSLLQTFENSRPGLTAEMFAEGGVESFFRDLYEKEVRRLQEKVDRLSHLSDDERRELFQRVDERIRKVVLPAYARLAARFTPRERNDFYLAPEEMHALERLGWAGAGLALGGFVVWAPFIPLWSKEWVLVFGVGGFAFPSVRRFFALRRYQLELNDLVNRTDEEIWRLDLGYMTAAAAREPALAAGASASEGTPEDESARLAARLEDAARVSSSAPASPRDGRAKEGDR